MIKLSFSREETDALHLTFGLTELAAEHGFMPFCPEGLPVRIKTVSGDRISVHADEREAVISCDTGRRFVFFRALSLLLEQLSAGKNPVGAEEKAPFDETASMLDLSQGNMALNTKSFRRFLRDQLFIGMGMCFLYMEDSFVIPEQPYFGYMRGRYTEDELRELDDYADAIGVELVPFVQTLAHLTTVMQWDAFEGIRENHRALCPGSERTYDYIRQVLTAASRPFRTRKIHLGMDESPFLGRGAYYLRHGDRPSQDIFSEHLERVAAIAGELGLSPMIFDDMLPPDSPEREKAPKGMGLVWWNYSSHTVEWCENKLRLRRYPEHQSHIFIAAWTYLSFAPQWFETCGNMSFVQACRNLGLRKCCLSIWEIGQDIDFRVNRYALQIFAEYCYNDHPDEAWIDRRFRFCFGAEAEDYKALTDFDLIPGTECGSKHPSAASEFLVWQDPMAGLFDYHLINKPVREHFRALSRKMAAAEKRSKGRYDASVFRYYHLLAQFLELKADLGVRITEAYRNERRDELLELTDRVLPLAVRRAERVRECFRANWMELGKPLGFEVYDIRWGGLIARLKSSRDSLKDYLGGGRKPEELDAERLPYLRGGMGFSGDIPSWTDKYGRICSASPITQEWWLKLSKEP